MRFYRKQPLRLRLRAVAKQAELAGDEGGDDEGGRRVEVEVEGHLLVENLHRGGGRGQRRAGTEGVSSNMGVLRRKTYGATVVDAEVVAEAEASSQIGGGEAATGQGDGAAAVYRWEGGGATLGRGGAAAPGRRQGAGEATRALGKQIGRAHV